MKKYSRIVFVTDSGTGRGPMAEEIMKELLGDEDIEVCSRGRVVLFPEPLNQKAELILDLKGKRKEGYMSIPLTQEDFTGDSLIIVMEANQKGNVLNEFSDTEHVYTLSELIGEKGDIRSPYGGTLAMYDECYNLLQSQLEKLVQKFTEEDNE